jgi:4a-hydroxytetrahydrobiopterin dehydratase
VQCSLWWLHSRHQVPAQRFTEERTKGRRSTMDSKLSQMKCSACRGDEPPLTSIEIEEMMSQVSDWELVEMDGVKRLQRTFKFKNFVAALEFTNLVGAIAEEEGHHPVITLTWGRATVTWYTHKINGLHENDFIMAAKTDTLRTAG